LEAWEIDPRFERGLQKNLPNAVVKIVTIKMIGELER
jgi:hypothetical protein